MHYDARMKWFFVVTLVTALASCATAGSDGDDGTPAPDAKPPSVFPDAARFPDAMPTPDANPLVSYDATPTTPDAGGGGIFCEDSDMCAAGKCCLLSLCIPGEEVLGLCIPD